MEIESSISLWYSDWLIEQVRNVEKNPTTLNMVNPNPKLPGGGKEFSSSRRRTICRFYVYRIWDLVPVCLYVIEFLKIYDKIISISKKWGKDDITWRCRYRTPPWLTYDITRVIGVFPFFGRSNRRQFITFVDLYLCFFKWLFLLMKNELKVKNNTRPSPW